MNDEQIVLRATFDPRLKTYLFLYSSLIIMATVIGVLFLPFWLFIGPLWARRYMERLSCVLTDRSLHVKRGVLFRIEKTIPLDKIQDFTLRHGPLQRALGLCALRIETAGQSAEGTAEANLIGIVDAEAFRNRVLLERDRVTALGAAPAAVPQIPAPANAGTEPLLRDIRDALVRIEGHLKAAGTDGRSNG